MTKIQSLSSAGPSRWLVVGIVIVGLVSLINLAAMILFAVAKVRTGQDHETHRTFWLVEDDYVGALIFFACVLAAIGIGLIMRLVQQQRERRAWRQLDRKWTQNSGA